MSSPNPAKRKFKLMVGVMILLFVVVVLWSIQASRQPSANLGATLTQAAILLIILALIVPLIIRMRGDIKRGLPLEDERSQNIKMRAGYYAYIVSIYLWLGIMMFSDRFTVDSAIAAAIMGAAVAFAGAYLYLSRKP